MLYSRVEPNFKICVGLYLPVLSTNSGPGFPITQHRTKIVRKSWLESKAREKEASGCVVKRERVGGFVFSFNSVRVFGMELILSPFFVFKY